MGQRLRLVYLPLRFAGRSIRPLKQSEPIWGWVDLVVRVAIILGVVSVATFGALQDSLRWMLTILAPTGITLLFLMEGARLLYEKDKRDGVAKRRWFFRLGGIAFTRPSLNRPRFIIAVDIGITNQEDSANGISHFVLETLSSKGNKQWSDPATGADAKDALTINQRDDIRAPLLFKPKEPQIGQLTFEVLDIDFNQAVPLLYIRDGDGTEYRIRLEGKTITKISSGSRTEDYPS